MSSIEWKIPINLVSFPGVGLASCVLIWIQTQLPLHIRHTCACTHSVHSNCILTPLYCIIVSKLNVKWFVLTQYTNKCLCSTFTDKKYLLKNSIQILTLAFLLFFNRWRLVFSHPSSYLNIIVLYSDIMLSSVDFLSCAIFTVPCCSFISCGCCSHSYVDVTAAVLSVVV